MKRNLLGICLLGALFLLPATVQAQFSFTTNNDAITITGYNTAAGLNAVIPDATNGYPVTSIGDYAFYNSHFYNSTVTNVVIPNSVTNIGDYAFYQCYGLTSVTIPNSVTSIGSYAFYACSGLTNLTIGTSVTSIGTYAFYDCSGLTSVTIPTSVTSIGDAAFAFCSGLTAITVDALNSCYSSVAGVLFNKSQTTLIQCPERKVGSYVIPNSVTSIGDAAFAVCSGLTNLTIGTSVTSIGDSAFYGCSDLTSATIPNGVTSIGDYAFFACSGLTNLTIGTSVTSIGSYAFSSCSGLTSVTIPNSVISIGSYAFYALPALTAITVDALNSCFSSVAGVLFNKSQTTLIRCPEGKVGSYVISNSVTSIGDYAFDHCSGLTSVTIPNSVTSIGSDAFVGCSLTSVTIPNSVISIGSGAFYNCSGLTAAYFFGNAPTGDNTVFSGESGTAYYLPGTTGWSSTFGRWPTALWYQPNPMILGSGYGLGATTNGFGFTMSWATNVPVVVEACTNLANPIWTPVTTNALVNGTNYFSDPNWTNYPGRFYRLRSP